MQTARGVTGDALAAALEATRLRTGARRAFWTSPDREPLAAPPVVRAGGRTEATIEHGSSAGLGRTLDWRVLREVLPGRLVRLERADLALSPRFAGADGTRLVLCAAGATVRTANRSALLGLWLDEGAVVEDDVVHEGAELLAALSELERVGRAHEEARSLEALGRRASHLAHDLRHLLTISRLTLERARIEGGAGEALARELDPLLLAAADLCEGALHGDDEEPTRASSGAANGATCELLTVLHDAVRTASGVAGRDDVRVRVSCPAELVVRGARATVLRLFVNLTLNAIEVSPTAAEVRLEATRAGDRNFVRVIDEGPGREQKELALAGPRSASSARPGRGFGLDSVRAGVAELRGTIGARATTGTGSAIEVALPSATAPEAAGGEPVVLVDADEERRAVVASALGRNGYTVAAVGEPAAALEVLRTSTGRPCVVAVARGTPGRGLGRLVRRAGLQGIPCVALGGADARERVIEIARAAGRQAGARG